MINMEEFIEVQERDMAKMMHRIIGALTCLNPEGKLVKGTAFLVSHNILLTAALKISSIFEGLSRFSFKKFKYYSLFSCSLEIIFESKLIPISFEYSS